MELQAVGSGAWTALLWVRIWTAKLVEAIFKPVFLIA
jgi:hypothetical protein